MRIKQFGRVIVEVFPKKRLYSLLETDYAIPFPSNIVENSWILVKSEFLHLGGLLG